MILKKKNKQTKKQNKNKKQKKKGALSKNQYGLVRSQKGRAQAADVTLPGELPAEISEEKHMLIERCSQMQSALQAGSSDLL